MKYFTKLTITITTNHYVYNTNEMPIFIVFYEHTDTQTHNIYDQHTLPPILHNEGNYKCKLDFCWNYN